MALPNTTSVVWSGQSGTATYFSRATIISGYQYPPYQVSSTIQWAKEYVREVAASRAHKAGHAVERVASDKLDQLEDIQLELWASGLSAYAPEKSAITQNQGHTHHSIVNPVLFDITEFITIARASLTAFASSHPQLDRGTCDSLSHACMIGSSTHHTWFFHIMTLIALSKADTLIYALDPVSSLPIAVTRLDIYELMQIIHKAEVRLATVAPPQWVAQLEQRQGRRAMGDLLSYMKSVSALCEYAAAVYTHTTQSYDDQTLIASTYRSAIPEISRMGLGHASHAEASRMAALLTGDYSNQQVLDPGRIAYVMFTHGIITACSPSEDQAVPQFCWNYLYHRLVRGAAGRTPSHVIHGLFDDTIVVRLRGNTRLQVEPYRGGVLGLRPKVVKIAPKHRRDITFVRFVHNGRTIEFYNSAVVTTGQSSGAHEMWYLGPGIGALVRRTTVRADNPTYATGHVIGWIEFLTPSQADEAFAAIAPIKGNLSGISMTHEVGLALIKNLVTISPFSCLSYRNKSCRGHVSSIAGTRDARLSLTHGKLGCGIVSTIFDGVTTRPTGWLYKRVSRIKTWDPGGYRIWGITRQHIYDGAHATTCLISTAHSGFKGGMNSTHGQSITAQLAP